MTATTTRCRRCTGPIDERPARSRVTVDRSLPICALCGQDEAVRDATGQAPIPPDQWPVR